MDDLVVGRGVVIPAEELLVRFSRAGGPGGQNVNKRDTRVEIVFDVAASGAFSMEQRRRVTSALRPRLDSRGRIRVVSSVERTQARNRENALETLRRELARGLRPPPRPRVATKPTKTAKERRISSKKARGSLKRQRARPGADD